MINELLSRVQPGDLIPLFAISVTFGTGAVIAVTAIIAGNIRGYREREMGIALIHELVERGLPTEEIERLIETSEALVSGRGRHFSRLLRAVERRVASSYPPAK